MNIIKTNFSRNGSILLSYPLAVTSSHRPGAFLLLAFLACLAPRSGIIRDYSGRNRISKTFSSAMYDVEPFLVGSFEFLTANQHPVSLLISRSIHQCEVVVPISVLMTIKRAFPAICCSTLVCHRALVCSESCPESNQPFNAHGFSIFFF